MDRVVITGGGGRLGTAVAMSLADRGAAVALIDRAYPSWLPDRPGIDCHLADLLHPGRATRVAEDLVARADQVVHLASLHGLHLVQGASDRDLWRANVEGTLRVADAAAAGRTSRFVFASTTAVYGAGGPPGAPAAILDEVRPPAPDNGYALTKIVGEEIVSSLAGTGLTPISLRLGRFFRADERSYQIRKLSTGLDLEDAVDAVVAALSAPLLAAGVYCVASDLQLSRDARQALGLDSHRVLDAHLPGFLRAAAERGWTVPTQVTKSVDSTRLQKSTSFRPRRSLRSVHQLWRVEDMHDTHAGP